MTVSPSLSMRGMRCNMLLTLQHVMVTNKTQLFPNSAMLPKFKYISIMLDILIGNTVEIAAVYATPPPFI